MSGRLTIWIDGREALPVRAIPYVAGWERLYHPESVARNLARKEGAPFDKLQNLVAYRRIAGKPLPVMANEWTAVMAELKGYETEFRERRPNIDEEDDHAGYSAWRKGAALKLPAGVFVWLDEFLCEREADRKRMPDNVPVTLAPMLDADKRAAMLEGFEDCPRRGPDTDQAMIGYADFVAICQVDDPKNFGGFRVEANGLYVDLPPADVTLTPEERATVTWHPTGQYDKPALPLPSTLRQLRAFLPDAGMAGCIDEEAVDAVLGEHDHMIGWYDNTMNAAMWFKRASVKPDEAAMLLCRIDPLERDWQGNAPDSERIYVDDDKASPDRYRLLLRAFLDVADTDPKPRTLLDWRDVAKREELRYHKWIDEYVQVQIEELPADTGSGGGTAKVGAGATAASTLPEGIPTGTIIDRFKLTDAWADKLKHISRNPFLRAALMRAGRRKLGKTPATPHLWNPVVLAEIFIERDGRNRRAMEAVITHHFAVWQDVWNESMESDETDEYAA
jgi:hypothetical protein